MKLHIDQSVSPVAQPERRTPFNWREKEVRELKSLEENDIIEVVSNEPTPWLNPLIVVHKDSGDIRLCSDIRKIIRVIKGTRFQTPTVHNLVAKLSNANFFAKLDMNSAFHQL